MTHHSPLTYPLEQMLSIKKNRFDQAVKTLEEKKVLLEKAKTKLQEVTAERDQVLLHKKEKLTQIRSALDEGAPTDKIQQMKVYLKVVDERLAEKERKVKDAQKVVDQAQTQVDLATKEMFQKKKDLEKIEMHKKEWEKEVQYLVEQKEAMEHDEQGAATYSIRKKEAAQRKKNLEKPDSQ